MAIDPNLDMLIACDPEALSWALLLAYACGYDAANGCGYDAANGCGLVDIQDDRLAALMRATEAAWQARRRLETPRRPAWLEALISEVYGPEPWPEEII